MSAMCEPALTVPDHGMVEQIKFVGYNVVAHIIVVVGILGNLLSLVVLTRPKMKARNISCFS